MCLFPTFWCRCPSVLILLFPFFQGFGVCGQGVGLFFPLVFGVLFFSSWVLVPSLGFGGFFEPSNDPDRPPGPTGCFH